MEKKYIKLPDIEQNQIILDAYVLLNSYEIGLNPAGVGIVHIPGKATVRLSKRIDKGKV